MRKFKQIEKIKSKLINKIKKLDLVYCNMDLSGMNIKELKKLLRKLLKLT